MTKKVNYVKSNPEMKTRWVLSFLLLVPVLSNAYTFDSDLPRAVKDQISSDMAFLKTIQGNGATPLHQAIFGTVDGPGYAKFFEDRITGVGFSDCDDRSAVACVVPLEDSSKMWVTRNYTEIDHPRIARLMILFHESRHTEDRHHNWPHALCPTPFTDDQGHEMKSLWTGISLAGSSGCDLTWMGSYGSTAIMLNNIRKFCTNCTGKVKLDAGLYGDDQMGRVTDPEAKTQMQEDLHGRERGASP